MRIISVLAVILSSSALACGNPERTEAVRLARQLQQQQATISEAYGREPAVIEGMKQWGGMIAFLGSNGSNGNPATRASNFANNMQGEKDQIAGVRSALENEQLEFAPTQTIRTDVVQSLRAREAYLDRIIGILNRSAEAFPSVNGMQYPRSIADLNQELGSYTPPSSTLANAIQNLRLKYNITDNDLESSK